MQFTEFGKSIAYAIDENQKKNAWRTVISKIAAYDDFINYFLLNKKGISTCEIDTIKNFWGSKDICKSDTMRKDASITFGYILSLAGLGEFKKGKQNTSWIEFYLEEVKKYCDNDDTSSGFNLAQTENNLIKSITSQNTENNQVNIPDHSNSLLIPKQIKQSNINVNISINVASIEELQKIIEVQKQVKKELNDENDKDSEKPELKEKNPEEKNKEDDKGTKEEEPVVEENREPDGSEI